MKPLEQPISLNHPKFPANSSYAISKTASEDYIEISGLDYVTFRLAKRDWSPRIWPVAHFLSKTKRWQKMLRDHGQTRFRFRGRPVPGCFACDRRNWFRGLSFSSGKGVAIKELYDAVVEAMDLTEYPEPEIRELEPDDAPSILLDPSRTIEDFGQMEFTPLLKLLGLAWNTSANLGPPADILI